MAVLWPVCQGAVHLVAQAPHLDVVGVLHPVGDPQVAVLGAGGMVAVLQQVAGGLDAPGTQVHGHHHVGIRFFGPGGELVDAHQVGLGAAPGQLQPAGTLGHRAHAVLPVEVGHEVAAGVPDDGYADLFYQVQHVLAEALFVRRGVPGLVDAPVHRPAQMLDKRAVDALVDGADLEILVQGDPCEFIHTVSPLLPCAPGRLGFFTLIIAHLVGAGQWGAEIFAKSRN